MVASKTNTQKGETRRLRFDVVKECLTRFWTGPRNIQCTPLGRGSQSAGHARHHRSSNTHSTLVCSHALRLPAGGTAGRPEMKSPGCLSQPGPKSRFRPGSLQITGTSPSADLVCSRAAPGGCSSASRRLARQSPERPERFRRSPKLGDAPQLLSHPKACLRPYPCSRPPVSRAWPGWVAMVRSYLRCAHWSFAQP
jgi:hypothetical protein